MKIGRNKEEGMSDKYLVLESWKIPNKKNDTPEQIFSLEGMITKTDVKPVIPYDAIRCEFFDALIRDYFYQHFYEWIKIKGD